MQSTRGSQKKIKHVILNGKPRKGSPMRKSRFVFLWVFTAVKKKYIPYGTCSRIQPASATIVVQLYTHTSTSEHVLISCGEENNLI